MDGSVLAMTGVGGAARRARATTGVLFAILALAFVVSLLLGPSDFAPGEILRGLFDGKGAAGIIARELRLPPRAGLAIAVGAALAASGAALQGLSPQSPGRTRRHGRDVLRGLGAVVAIYFGLTVRACLPAAAVAITGALVSAGILYLLSRRGAGANRAGAGRRGGGEPGDGADGAGAVLRAQSLCDERHGVLDDGLAQGRPSRADLYFAATLTLAGVLLLLSASRGLDALTLGEEAAQSLGIDVGSVRGRVVIGVALATGAATAAAGAVSFVGMVVPHVSAAVLRL